MASWAVRQGDCLDVPLPVGVGLVYADPPFGSGVVRQGRAGGYDDLRVGREYLGWLAPRILWAASRVEAGWLCLHMDPLVGARAQVMLEDTWLGEAAGVVAWQDAWVSGFRSRASRFWPRVHDTLTFWRVGDAPFNPTVEPAPDGYKRRGGGGGTERAAGDLWVGPWSPGHLSFSKEKVGWPDQKPLALLDRVIRACTQEGDLVLDPFCGSGTTLVAALRAGRRAFGVDLSPEAVALTAQRCGQA